ncbi:MAG: hypothetical protein WCG08_06000 [Paludibacter sp.]|jgi:hypothetical protein
MEKIELRSEKVRNLIGRIPPKIIRSGTLVLFVVFLSLLISSYFFPYSETITVPVQIKEYQISTTHSLTKSYIAIAFVPIDIQSKIIVGQKSFIEIEGYNKNTYGQIVSSIYSRSNRPIIKDKKKYILFQLSLQNGLTSNKGKTISYYDNMQGTATITLKKERLMTILFSWIK